MMARVQRVLSVLCGISVACNVACGTNSASNSAAPVNRNEKGKTADASISTLESASCDTPDLGISSSTPVVFDTDADFDDLIALALMVQKKVNLVGVSVTPAGWGLPNTAAQHVAQVLKYLGICVPIHMGGSRISANPPINFTEFTKFQATIEQAINTGLLAVAKQDAGATVDAGNELAACPINGTSDDPIGNIVSKLNDQSQKIAIVATGPLTNVARFLKNSPKQTQLIVYDGQTIGEKHGLNGPSNNQMDATAGKQVFASGIRVVMVEDSFIHQTPLAIKIVQDPSYPSTRAANLVKSLVVTVANSEKGEPVRLFMWDAVAAAVYIDYKGMVSTHVPANVSINDDVDAGKGYGEGLSLPGTNHLVTVSVVPGAFEQMLVNALSGNP